MRGSAFCGRVSLGFHGNYCTKNRKPFADGMRALLRTVHVTDVIPVVLHLCSAAMKDMEIILHDRNTGR